MLDEHGHLRKHVAIFIDCMRVRGRELLADTVNNVLHDPRDDTLYATLNLGHFGVKLRRSNDHGKTWEELDAPTYPPQPKEATGAPWQLILIWCLATGGKDEPGVLWAGTIPGTSSAHEIAAAHGSSCAA